MASVTPTASLPIARNASTIAIVDPIASPSGRWCEATTKRRPLRMRSTNSAGGFIILDRGRVLAVDHRVDDAGILDGPRRVLGVNLLDDFLDARLSGDRFVVDELDLGHAAQ